MNSSLYHATKSVWEWLVKKSDEQDGESDV